MLGSNVVCKPTGLQTALIFKRNTIKSFVYFFCNFSLNKKLDSHLLVSLAFIRRFISRRNIGSLSDRTFSFRHSTRSFLRRLSSSFYFVSFAVASLASASIDIATTNVSKWHKSFISQLKKPKFYQQDEFKSLVVVDIERKRNYNGSYSFQ